MVTSLRPARPGPASRRYVLQLPSTIPGACVPAGCTIRDILDISLTINTGGQKA
jgi:hypothetical protein